MADLSARGKIRVSGEDRARLLHAMTTNSVNDLPAGSGIYLFFLNDKGRILGDAYLYNFGADMLLDTEPETAAKIHDHLDRFIIADDVTLEDEADQWAEIGLEGPKSIELQPAPDLLSRKPDMASSTGAAASLRESPAPARRDCESSSPSLKRTN